MQITNQISIKKKRLSRNSFNKKLFRTSDCLQILKNEEKYYQQHAETASNIASKRSFDRNHCIMS